MPTPSAIEAAVRDYCRFFESLTRESVAQIDKLCAPNVRFRDPFNDLEGVAAYRRALAKMFDDVEAPRFSVTDQAIHDLTCYLRWSFTCRRGKRQFNIEGVSEVHFDDQGRVLAHIDHWDAASQVYARFAILGPILRLVRNRLAVEP